MYFFGNTWESIIEREYGWERELERRIMRELFPRATDSQINDLVENSKGGSISTNHSRQSESFYIEISLDEAIDTRKEYDNELNISISIGDHNRPRDVWAPDYVNWTELDAAIIEEAVRQFNEYDERGRWKKRLQNESKKSIETKEEHTKESILKDTALHIRGVKKITNSFIKDLKEVSNKHDSSKLKNPKLLADFLNDTKNKENKEKWLDYHYKREVHHPETMNEKKVTLAHIVEMLADWTEAAQSRDGRNATLDEKDLIKKINKYRDKGDKITLNDWLFSACQNTLKQMNKEYKGKKKKSNEATYNPIQRRTDILLNANLRDLKKKKKKSQVDIDDLLLINIKDLKKKRRGK